MGVVNLVRSRIDRLIDSAGGLVLDGAGRLMADEVRRRLDVAGSGIPSAPGEPPRKQTGELQRSVSYQVDKKARRVHVTVDHPAAFYLEFGTDLMAPRPFLRQTLHSFGSTFGRGRFGALLGARHSPLEPIAMTPPI